MSFFTSLMSFFSFSYTYTKGQTLKELDLVGCDDMENPESMDRFKTVTNADAISLFSFEGEQRRKTFRNCFITN